MYKTLRQTSEIPAIKNIGEKLRRHREHFFRYDKEIKNAYAKVNEHTVLIQVQASTLLKKITDFSDKITGNRISARTVKINHSF